MEYKQELRDKTFKDENLDIGQRVFYTLRGDANTPPKLQIDANSKLLGLLIEQLRNSGHLSDAEIDELLFQTTR